MYVAPPWRRKALPSSDLMNSIASMSKLETRNASEISRQIVGSFAASSNPLRMIASMSPRSAKNIAFVVRGWILPPSGLLISSSSFASLHWVNRNPMSFLAVLESRGRCLFRIPSHPCAMRSFRISTLACASRAFTPRASIISFRQISLGRRGRYFLRSSACSPEMAPLQKEMRFVSRRILCTFMGSSLTSASRSMSNSSALSGSSWRL
mmetsp:Transcript_35980/g.70796  ORF Transcript_35980/g.70796 Transcript_35980/m.70796 type:complete len:209 (+) Transcript_35980:1677-2303(+)